MGKREQRRRADLARHVVDNQIEPQLAAERARESGIDVEAVFVSNNPDAEGFTLTCTGCGRTATLPFDPGKKVGLCPACVKAQGF